MFFAAADGADDPGCRPSLVIRVIRGSLSSVSPKVNVAVMPSQEIHKTFVIGLRNVQQWQHPFVAASCALESLPDEMFYLIPGYQSFGVWPRHRFPEIADDHLLQLPRFVAFQRQRHIVCLDYGTGRRTHRRLHNILQLANITWKCVCHQLCNGRVAHLLSTAVQHVFNEQRHVFHSTAQRWNLNWKYIQSIVKVFTKIASTNQWYQLAVCRRDHSQVELAHDHVAKPAQLPILEYS